MNKTELAEMLANKADLTMKDAREVVGLLFDTNPKKGIIAGEIAKGKRVQITGFGTFETRKRKKRKGRNPQTGAVIDIPASKAPVFAAGRALKDSVNKR